MHCHCGLTKKGPYMNPTNDQVKGTFNSAAGKTKDVAGRMLKDRDLQAEGKFQNVKGKAQKASGSLKEKIQDASYKAGDKIEHAGRDAQLKGYTKTGKALENLGEKIEHMHDD